MPWLCHLTLLLVFLSAFLYDAMGRVERVGQPVFDEVLAEGSYVAPPGGSPRSPRAFTYDAKGRVTETLEPDGVSTKFSFGIDSVGSGAPKAWTRVEDAEEKVRTEYHDARGRLVAVAERLGSQDFFIRYHYNPLDELVGVVDAKGNSTTATYDALGRRTRLVNPDTGPTAYEYDLAGNLTAQVDARGRRLAYHHDFNRLVRVVRPSGADVTYRYGAPGAPENGAGRLVEVVDEGGVETRGYTSSARWCGLPARWRRSGPASGAGSTPPGSSSTPSAACCGWSTRTASASPTTTTRAASSARPQASATGSGRCTSRTSATTSLADASP